MIQFHNTLSGKREDFQPLHGKEVRMYACGPTVYDFAHIGNFRTFIFEDLLRRFLEFKGFRVKHVMNITDVDDKTIAGASRENIPLGEFTTKYTDAFFADLKTLNILMPNHPAHPPRATAEIAEMIRIIEKLMEKQVAYEKDQSVYYRVAKFDDYGKLSKKKLEKNIQGARVDVDEYEKEEGADFVLWKKAKEGEPSWHSPWGKGRPGWHIECSAMSMKYLGETFDIHAGGEDLIFPHHENEIAQSEAATGKKFVNFWLHSKHLLVNGEKMSKSKGNFFTLRDLLRKGYDPMAIRYALLGIHYRNPLNFTLEGLKEAAESVKKLDDCYWQCVSYASLKGIYQAGEVEIINLKQEIDKYETEITKYLADDLNVAAALAQFSEIVGVINAGFAQRKIEPKEIKEALTFFKRMDSLFGFDVTGVSTVSSGIQSRLASQAEFRKNKNFQEADKVRAELKQSGWLVKDGRPGEPSTVKKIRRVWDK